MQKEMKNQKKIKNYDFFFFLAQADKAANNMVII